MNKFSKDKSFIKEDNVKSKTVIPVCLIVSDDNFVTSVPTMLSIICNTDCFVKFYLFQSNKRKIKNSKLKRMENLKKKYNNFSINVFTIDEDKYKNYPQSKVEQVINDTYFRFEIPDIIFDFDKAIYVDTDIIFLNDIINLFNIDLKDNLIGAVRNEEPPYMNLNMLNVIRNCGLKDIHSYFSNGVLLFNLELCRKNNISTKLKQLVTQRGSELNYADQDAFNIIFEKSNLRLDNKFNMYPFRIDDYGYLPDVIHYVGIFKPWKKKFKYSQYYWDYAKLTPFWKDFKKAYKSVNNVFKPNSFLENIFSVKNSEKHKVITFLFIQLKIPRKQALIGTPPPQQQAAFAFTNSRYCLCTEHL